MSRVTNAFTYMFSGVSSLEKLIVSDKTVYLSNGNVAATYEAYYEPITNP